MASAAAAARRRSCSIVAFAQGGTEKTPIRAENLRVLWAELAFDDSERRTFSSRRGDGFRDSDAADRH